MKLCDIAPSLWPTNQTDVKKVHIFPQYVQLGDLFVSLPSRTSDDLEKIKIDRAIENGARAVIKRRNLKYVFPENVIAVEVDDPRHTMAEIASHLTPGQPTFVAGITGTCGKSSVAAFTRQIWQNLGFMASSMGSLGIITPEDKIISLMDATPAWGKTRVFYAYLQALSQKGFTHLALELTSAVLEQCRADAVFFKAGVFTNLSFEHLNYHKTMEAYFKAKTRLFSQLLDPGSLVVVNLADTYAERIFEICKERKHRVVTFGTSHSDIHLTSIQPFTDHSELRLSIFGKKHHISFPVPSSFQAHNLLAALGLTIGLGGSVKNVLRSVSSLSPVSGRFERVGSLPNKASIYIDFAHKPAGLEAVLLEARRLAAPQGKVTVVFGCDGNADAQKRPIMGIIANRLADRIIITDDHPRNVDASFVRKEIITACPEAYDIPSRLNAIKCAIRTLNAGDICVVIARASHGQNQEKTTSFAKEERKIVQEALQCIA